MKRQSLKVAIPDHECVFSGRLAELEAENARLRLLDETIRRNNRLVRALLEKSHDGMMLVNQDTTILTTVHSVLGYKGDHLAGRSVLEVVHPEDQARVRAAFATLANNPSKALTFECRVHDSDGQWCWMEVEMTDMLDDPDIQAIVLNNRRAVAPRPGNEQSIG